MKKRDILLGTFMIVCSLSAYIFLVQLQNEGQGDSSTPLYQELAEQDKNATSPDVDVFKHVVTVFTKLLPAS